MRRIVILIALSMVFGVTCRAQSGTNCSHGSYTLTSSSYNQPPCGSNPTPMITQTDAYALSCQTTYGNQTPGQFITR